MIPWKKFVVGGAITVAAIGSSSAYAYACNHQPHKPPHKPPHSTTTTTSTQPSTTTTSTTAPPS